MKDLLSKEHYCHNVHTILIKSIGYRPPIIIIVIMIIILIIIFNMILSSSSLSLISLSPFGVSLSKYQSIIYNIIWEQTCFHPYLLKAIYQSDPESYGKLKNCDKE